jgi:hypothetical protein
VIIKEYVKTKWGIRKKRRKKMIPKLTINNQHDFFGVKAKHKELFNYTAAFLYRDVENLAKQHGYMTEYCDPDTLQYRTYGDRTCTALERAEVEKTIGEDTRGVAPAEEAMGSLGLPEQQWDVDKKETAPGLPKQLEEFRTKIANLVLEFESRKNEAADIRDKLRDIADEIKDIVESFDDGVEGMDEALEQFKHALDDMSRYV